MEHLSQGRTNTVATIVIGNPSEPSALNLFEIQNSVQVYYTGLFNNLAVKNRDILMYL